jgi:hypothetical protein
VSACLPTSSSASIACSIGRPTARQRPATRTAAIREALCAWLDDHEQRAGLVEPHRRCQQFQTAYQRLASHHDSVPSHPLRQWLSWPRERLDTVLEALRAAPHVDLETGTARELSPQALADSYPVHGQLSVRVRWRA